MKYFFSYSTKLAAEKQKKEKPKRECFELKK